VRCSNRGKFALLKRKNPPARPHAGKLQSLNMELAVSVRQWAIRSGPEHFKCGLKTGKVVKGLLFTTCHRPCRGRNNQSLALHLFTLSSASR